MAGSGARRAEISADRIFDGEAWHEGARLVIEGGRVVALAPGRAAAHHPLIAPGFVDLQVNGGGGVQFNADITAGGLATICKAHLKGGATAIMATLISDRPEAVRAALAAVAGARAAGQPGLAGLHLEGPHLALARKGIHDPRMLRPMEAADVAMIVAEAPAAGRVLVTVAPEAVTPAQIGELAGQGILVSLGHSDCTLEAARAAFDAGARLGTHLFNAMSQLGHRAPGLTGAILDDGRVWCGLIADGHHVDPVAMGIALRAKRGPGRIFLISDAMAVTGTDLPGFTLYGREIFRRGNRLTSADGTLAGADITMLDAVRYVHRHLDLPLGEALRMAARYPAEAAGLIGKGRLSPGADADFVVLADDLTLDETWIGGRALYRAGG